MTELRETPHRLRVEDRNDAVVVTLEGVCDSECTEELDTIISQIEMTGERNIVLDASHVDYIETPGFRWLVNRFCKLQELGFSLVVAGLAGSAERAFNLLQLDKFIPAVSSVEAAIARLRKGNPK